MTGHGAPQDGGRRRRVLITGATGAIGALLAERLAEGGEEFEVLRHGRRAQTEEDRERLLLADLSDAAAVESVMQDVDVVVHLAGASSVDSSWEDVLEANIVGTRNVLEAAHRAGVTRVVLASSNHAMGMYDRDGDWPVQSDDLPRPDSLYGVSKVFGEALGRYYHDAFGLEVISLRIGWYAEDPAESQEELLRAMWLSPGDCVRVFQAAIQAPVAYGVYYAISENPNRRWDLTNTLVELGYRPQDSWMRALGAEEDVVPGGADVRQNWPEGS